MIQTGLIQSAHADLVTDASYDFYGQRLATCSLDQRIKVWQLDENTGAWTLQDDWKAHDAAVSKVTWAHPEFGSIIASSSFDRTVKIWEQSYLSNAADATQISLNGSGAARQGSPPTQPNSSASRWVQRASLVDAKGTVRAVEFAPHHFGLKLAAISSDKYLRIYECLEQPSLAAWQVSEELNVEALPSSSPFYMTQGHTVALATPTQANAPHDGASASLVAQALQSHSGMQNSQNKTGSGNREADGGYCISWCKDRYWGEAIAAGCGVTGIIKIIQLSSSRRPVTVLVLDPAPALPTAAEGSAETEASVTYAVTCVAWAPSCGRSYHLIATGGRDGHVRIWRVKPGAEEEDDDDTEADVEDKKWSASIVADFDHHKSTVGRVEWNITGTVLSSAGNDGRIRLWKATSGSVWRPAGSIGVEEAEQDPGSVDADIDMETLSRRRE